MNQGGTWHGGGSWSTPHYARWEPSSPRQKGDRAAPDFQPAGCIKMLLGMDVGLSPGDLVLHGDPVPLPKNGRSPQFLAHVYCGQTPASIRMALGTAVGVGLRDIVLDGDPAPLP